MLINLIDARRGLHEKCMELFADKNIAEQIYRKLCEGIDDCEAAEKTGKWEPISKMGDAVQCSNCKKYWTWTFNTYEINYCPNCGARMEE